MKKKMISWTSGWKYLVVFLLGVIFTFAITNAFTLIHSTVENAIQFIRQTKFTDSGLDTGTVFMDINAGSGYIRINTWSLGNWTWRNSRFLALDALGNITYAAEQDPIFSSSPVSGITLTNINTWNSAYNRVRTNSWNALYFRNNSGNYLLVANSGDYYTSNPLGYITWYTENDPQWSAASGNYVLQSDTGNRNSAYNRIITSWDILRDRYTMSGFSSLSCSTGEIIKYNGSTWICSSDLVGWGGWSNYYTTGLYFDSGTNVLTLYVSGYGPVTGYIIFSGMDNWNSAYNRMNTSWNVLRNWYATTGIYINSLATTTGLNCSTGEIAKYNGSTWICSSDLIGSWGGWSNYYTTGLYFDSGTNVLTLYVSGYGPVTGSILFSGMDNWNSGYNRILNSGSFLRNRYTNSWSFLRNWYTTTGIYINTLATTTGLTCSAWQLIKYDWSAWVCSGDLVGSWGISYRTAIGDWTYTWIQYTGWDIKTNWFIAKWWWVSALWIYATAMGWNTQASWYISTSMGQNTQASWTGSTAMGAWTIASGNYSTAMGNTTQANWNYSTAMGFKTNANGDYSTAMGDGTTANWPVSTAMGDETIASWYISTAMGYQTTANWGYSTAMGYYTQANWNYSTAMGYYTKAIWASSISLWWNTTASWAFSTSMGQNTQAIWASSTAMWQGSIAIWDSSTTMGYQTQANWDYSTAMGYQTTGAWSYSTAMGRQTIANWDYSTVMGRQTIASWSNSTAMGLCTTAIWIDSTAMGNITIAKWDGSTSMGSVTIASGVNSTAMGDSTIAGWQISTAMGAHTTASWYISTAMGSHTTASWDSSTAMGHYTQALWNYSTAMGDETIAYGIGSIAMGYQTTADGTGSFALGYGTTANWNGSIAMGYYTHANWDSSTAMGEHTIANGVACTAMGNLNEITTWSDYSSIVWWQWNKIYSQNSFIGGGWSNTISWSSYYSVIPWWFSNTIENAQYSFAWGKNAQALHDYTFVRNGVGGDTVFQSAHSNSFIINAPGGVGIRTNNPQGDLDIAGSGVVVFEPQDTNPQGPWLTGCTVTWSIVYAKTSNNLCYCNWSWRTKLVGLNCAF